MFIKALIKVLAVEEKQKRDIFLISSFVAALKINLNGSTTG
jgi:hypothetical protein